MEDVATNAVPGCSASNPAAVELGQASSEADVHLAANSILGGLLQRVQRRFHATGCSADAASNVRSSMTPDLEGRYAKAILEVSRSQDATVVDPSILFAAADQSLSGDVSPSEARVGLQPGTFNPIHYGHISASLAGIVENQLDKVLLALGAAVPDKHESASFDVRIEMVRRATGTPRLSPLLQACPIRQQAADMFAREPALLALAGANATERRSNMDMAAFIWLFRTNPHVTWTYLIGSDKVAGYGRKGERSLLVDTLGNPHVRMQALYFARSDDDLNVERDIAAYDWMRERWRSGFFTRSPHSTCDVSSSRIRLALAQGRDDMAGASVIDCVPRAVLEYVRTQDNLLALYARSLKQPLLAEKRA